MFTKRSLLIAFIALAFLFCACGILKRHLPEQPAVEQPKPESGQKSEPTREAGLKKVDSDRDGVADDEDKCPTIPGLKENNGCPAEEAMMLPSPTVHDMDMDGVPDDEDHCPTVPGPLSNKGCPAKASGNPASAADEKNSTNQNRQDTTLRSATLGYTHNKIIPVGEMGDLRVHVRINGSEVLVRKEMRRIEAEDKRFVKTKDSSVINILKIEVYDSLLISPEYDKADFTLTPIFTEEKQKLDLVKGNDWYWKVRAVSEKPHTATIVLKIAGITPQGAKYKIHAFDVDIKIVISPPVTFWKKIANWINKNIIATSIPIIITAILAYYQKKILLFFRSRKRRKKDSL